MLENHGGLGIKCEEESSDMCISNFKFCHSKIQIVFSVCIFKLAKMPKSSIALFQKPKYGNSEKFLEKFASKPFPKNQASSA